MSITGQHYGLCDDQTEKVLSPWSLNQLRRELELIATERPQRFLDLSSELSRGEELHNSRFDPLPPATLHETFRRFFRNALGAAALVGFWAVFLFGSAQAFGLS